MEEFEAFLEAQKEREMEEKRKGKIKTWRKK